MWSLRGRLPLAVQASAQLIEIGICDQQQQRQTGAHSNSNDNSSSSRGHRYSDTELRLMYSLAVIRAVNGLADAQQQGYFADSVLSLATSLGVPAWIVELRHEATHSELPALGVLREASRVLVGWFHHNYWQRQSVHLDGISNCAAEVRVDKDGEQEEGDEELLAAMNTMTPSSYSHIIIPSFLDRVLQQVSVVPSRQQRVDDILRAVSCLDRRAVVQLLDGAERSWRAEVDGLLGPGRSRLVELSYLTEGLLLRLVAALRDCMALVLAADGKSTAGTGGASGTMTLLEWHVLVIIAMVCYTLEKYVDSGESGLAGMELLATLAARERGSLLSYVMPNSNSDKNSGSGNSEGTASMEGASPVVSAIISCIAKLSAYFSDALSRKSAKKRPRSDSSQQQIIEQGTSSIKRVSSSSSSSTSTTISTTASRPPLIRTDVFEPVVWPLGLMPGRLGGEDPLLLLSLQERQE